MDIYCEKSHMLYCSKKCAIQDGCDPDDLVAVSPQEIMDDEASVCDSEGNPIENAESKFWYSPEEGVTMPMFGRGCSVCEDLFAFSSKM